jgi:hypothetical protein
MDELQPYEPLTCYHWHHPNSPVLPQEDLPVHKKIRVSPKMGVLTAISIYIFPDKIAMGHP